MALEIFKLIGSVFVDTDKANDSLKKTDKHAEGLGKKMLSGVGTAAKWGAGIVAAAGAGAAALFGVTKKAAGAMDAIDKGSAKVGISKQAYQEWSYVLGQNGMDIGKLETGMKSLVASMDGAASGTKSAQDRFDALGISIYDSSGKLKNQEDMLNETMYALANMENGTEKARLATELFGKAGVEMMPMLNGGAAGMEELTARAHELGLVVSDEAVTAGVKLGDTLDDVKQSFGTIMNKIGVELMPIVQGALDWVLEKMPVIQTVCGTVFSVIGTAVSWIGSLFTSAMTSIDAAVSSSGITFSSVFTGMQALFQAVLAGLQSIWVTIGQPVFETIKVVLGTVWEYFRERMPQIKEFVQTAFMDIKELWTNHLQPVFQMIGDFLTNVVAPVFKFVFNNVIAPVVDSAFSHIKEMWNNYLKPVLTGITDFVGGVFSGNFTKAFSGIVTAVKGVFSGLVTVVKAPINAVISVLNKFISGINKIQLPSWVPMIGGKGINIPQIPKLWQGGVLEKGQVGYLEGNGAEAVVPLHQNKKWIQAVARDMEGAIGGDSQVLATLLDILAALEALSCMGVYLDQDKLVGQLAAPMDQKLGQLQAKKGRA